MTFNMHTCVFIIMRTCYVHNNLVSIRIDIVIIILRQEVFLDYYYFFFFQDAIIVNVFLIEVLIVLSGSSLYISL